MDRVCYNVLSQLGLSYINLIALEDFEKGDEELLRAKQDRRQVEYYFTCTPSLLLYILNNHPEVDIITYLDADLFFFAAPEPIYDEINGHSIAIIGHRFSSELRWREKFGIYNVGWLSFRQDGHALDCLKRWRKQCIEWCYSRAEDGRFADQKYLDDWPIRFKSVKILQHKGANLAPWNLANYNIHKSGNHVWADEHPLIFFHFHDFSSINRWLYDPCLAVQYKTKLSVIVRRSIYGPYIRALLEAAELVSSLMPEAIPLSSIRYRRIKSELPQSFSLLRQIKTSVRRWLRLWRGIFHREYIFTINGHVM